MKSILVIRGGAIGDFVLTLPAIKLLRDNLPRARIEILGYPHIIALAESRHYADAIRSIESGALASFFAKNSELPQKWVEYFGSFDFVLSYLFDPDGIFETNVKRCGVKDFVAGPAKLGGAEHAARQLARPLEKLGLHLEDPAARIYPDEKDREFGRDLLGEPRNDFIAIHPGSGSETKNWPIECWQELGENLFAAGRKVVVVSGEADQERVRLLETAWKEKPFRRATNLTLPRLAAVLENSTFIGHDSGISHLAAAVGARCVLLFGPTDPAVWAPANENVRVIQAPEGNLGWLTPDNVIAAISC
ncbi:MAG: glycosyltransferase family 9 protein [Verrucomicrobiota bacterium]|nr:glycosyltransferase family 9 protein [Verrucomicrobiota bacterium]